jgi:phosphonatase-like hydrolase
MKVEMVVFDMAGTTIDEDNIVYKTLQKSINEHGIEVTLDQVLAIGAGQEKLNAIKDVIKAYGTSDDLSKANEIFELFRKSLATAYEAFPISSIADAEDVLLALRSQNIKVVLNTGYDKTTANFILNKIQWRQFYHYDLLVTASDVKNSRPAPDMIQLAMNLFSMEDAGKIVKIGDSKIDIEEGKNAKCLYSIGVTTGAQTKLQLQEAAPDFIIDNLNELFSILKLD